MTSHPRRHRSGDPAAAVAGRNLGAAEVGRALNMTQPATWRRIKRLQDEGVIAGQRVVLDNAAVGFGVTVFLGIRLATKGRTSLEEFERAVTAIPEVQLVQHVLGQLDYRLRIVARDIADFERILRRRIMTLPGLGQVEANVLLSEERAGLRPAWLIQFSCIRNVIRPYINPQASRREVMMYHAIVCRRIRQLFDAINRGEVQPVLDGFSADAEHIFIGDHALSGPAGHARLDPGLVWAVAGLAAGSALHAAPDRRGGRAVVHHRHRRVDRDEYRHRWRQDAGKRRPCRPSAVGQGDAAGDPDRYCGADRDAAAHGGKQQRPVAGPTDRGPAGLARLSGQNSDS